MLALAHNQNHYFPHIIDITYCFVFARLLDRIRKILICKAYHYNIHISLQRSICDQRYSIKFQREYIYVYPRYKLLTFTIYIHPSLSKISCPKLALAHNQNHYFPHIIDITYCFVFARLLDRIRKILICKAYHYNIHISLQRSICDQRYSIKFQREYIYVYPRYKLLTFTIYIHPSLSKISCPKWAL